MLYFVISHMNTVEVQLYPHPQQNSQTD